MWCALGRGKKTKMILESVYEGSIYRAGGEGRRASSKSLSEPAHDSPKERGGSNPLKTSEGTGRSRIQTIAKKTTSRSGTEMQRQRNMIEGVQEAIKGRNAGVDKRRGARKISLGRPDKEVQVRMKIYETLDFTEDDGLTEGLERPYRGDIAALIECALLSSFLLLLELPELTAEEAIGRERVQAISPRQTVRLAHSGATPVAPATHSLALELRNAGLLIVQIASILCYTSLPMEDPAGGNMDSSGGSHSISVGGESTMGGGSSRGSGWTSFDLDVLAEPTANENERGEEVAQPNPPNALDNPKKNEIIGGDSVESIERRLLGRFSSPSAHEITMARIEAEDLFEVKVEIIQQMAVLYPSGDWTGRGARALDNPRAASGEPSLIELYRLR
ncbi:hypothetical protein VNO80_35201 [Phaseolus coccineus]|uniref:DUF8018 domain-containing protein n=1 Tax=Phaseolus coccineus TaxID=3886 RepID=A0AAN9KQQ9_PHACN